MTMPLLNAVLSTCGALLALAIGILLGVRYARRGAATPDVIRVSQVRNTFVVSGVYGNDSHVVRELILLYCIRRGLPPPELGAGGVPLRNEYGAAVWPFRFQGSEVRG